MKVKEKLSKNYADNICGILSEADDLEDAYLAGFDKAREMAAEVEYRCSANSEEYHEILELGEQEVNESHG